MKPTAAQVLVSALATAGADTVYCVPGESYLTALDAFYDAPGIRVIACRHEGGAGFMALADARLTGKPGIVFASRGPGAMNAAIALHAAEQDGVPLLLFVGHVTRNEAGRGAFQEVDYGKTFSDVAKGIFTVNEANRLPDQVAQAWQTAISGTPGPVVVVLPEDMLADPADVPPVPIASGVLPGPTGEDIAAVADRIAAAERPLLIAGSQIQSAAARTALAAAAERWGLPVLGAFKQQDLMSNDHPNWIGQIGFVMPPDLSKAVTQADLILAVGTRLGDITTQNYSFPSAPTPRQPLIHVYPDPSRIGRNIRPALGIVADGGRFLQALADHPQPGKVTGRREWVSELVAISRRLMTYAPVSSPQGVDFGAVVDAVSRHASDDCIFTLDSGNFASWVHRYLVVHGEQRLLGSASGAMGGGVPGGVAAALRHPDRMVVTFLGDGGALMTGNELATAVHYGARLKVIVANNGIYGTIRTYQEKSFPGRPVATDLTNPDFAEWARAFGVRGLTIEATGDVDAVISEALAYDGSVVVDVRQDTTRLTAFSPAAAVTAPTGS